MGGRIAGLMDYLSNSMFAWFPWRNRNGARGSRMGLAPVVVNTALHRQGVITAFISNVLGSEGIVPLFHDGSDRAAVDKLARIRAAKRSWRRLRVNERGDTPWTLQCQALASLVDYGLALVHHPPSSAEFYALDVGQLDQQRSGDAAYQVAGRDYPREEVIRLELPSYTGRFVNAFETKEPLEAVYELQGQAYIGFAGLLGLLGTLWERRNDIPEAENAAFRQDGIREQLKGPRIIPLANDASPPQILDIKADTAAMDSASAVTTRYKSGAYGLSSLAIDRDYSGVNYTSGLMAVHQDERVYDIYAAFMQTLAEAIYEIWDDVQAKSMMVGWSEPARPVLDPVKYATAMTRQYELGAVSMRDVIRGRGRDPEEVFLERQIEMEEAANGNTRPADTE